LVVGEFPVHFVGACWVDCDSCVGCDSSVDRAASYDSSGGRQQRWPPAEVKL
jgi:hypothetical protein